MKTRREFLKQASRWSLAATATAHLGCDGETPDPAEDGSPAAESSLGGIVLNDRQSQLNATRVRSVHTAESIKEVQSLVRKAQKENAFLSVAGGRHAMGAQQFGTDTLHLGTTKLNSVLNFDATAGQVEVEAGIQWPELIQWLHNEQKESKSVWSIRQKQTGVDNVTMAGTLSANAHGRGLRFPPIVSDVESIVLVDASGEPKTCSRTENPELFSLAIGGYGLFGIISHVTLRLVPRKKVERTVEVINVRDLLDRVEQRLGEGYQFGDCQYSTDFSDLTTTHQGVFSCYRPVADDTPVAENRKQLSAEEWGQIIYLGHTDRKKTFETYAEHYLATNGQIYWSDTHQMSNDFEGYHKLLDKRLGAKHPGSEMITEVYVPPAKLESFLKTARKAVHDDGINLVYGTIRFIEKDEDTFLAWAKDRSVCVLCNLHVDHTDDGIAKAARDARKLIGIAIENGGRYFPTYHRWASQQQVLAAYPQMPEFLQLKKKHDANERFQSDWYRHYRKMFGTGS